MKTMLIVEDEKMIRQGIHVMVKRSKVQIDEILECRNGAEAWELLNKRKIDVMFTDIRMPKMDGIQLVQQVKKLEEPPKIVVISGYDDFNYAVEMLKHGVEDYILKPIKREKIEEILDKLERKLWKEEKDREAEAYIFGKQFLHYLKSPVSVEEEKNTEYKFQQYIGNRKYVITIYGKKGNAVDVNLKDVFLQIEDEGQMLLVSGAESSNEDKLSELCAGISSVYETFPYCRKAYAEAIKARNHAWIHGISCCRWEPSMERDTCEADRDFARQFALKLSTEHWEEGVKHYRNLLFYAEHGEMPEENFISQAMQVGEELKSAYGNFFQKPQPVLAESPLSWANAQMYMQEFLDTIEDIRACLKEKYDNGKNQHKMRVAVQYIRDNFRKDLNMALVSNHVSMNYSLFSILFKEYTGVNFVTYLKNLRIEEAKRLLRETDQKVRDIGKAVGFENDKNFLKSFKVSCGVSPTEYRRTEEWKENL